MATVDDRIAAKRAELEKLQAQKRALEQKAHARQAGVKRKADTTAKVLLGAAALQAVKKAPNGTEWLGYLAGLLTEKDQKRLWSAFEVLGLPMPQPKPKNAVAG